MKATWKSIIACCAVFGVAMASQAAFSPMNGGYVEEFNGTTQDTATWTASTTAFSLSFTQNNNMTITATGSASGDVAGRGQYETNEKLVRPGDHVRVEITPNSAFPARGGGNNGHALVLGAENLGFDYDGGNYLWLRWSDGGYFTSGGDIQARARVGGNVVESQVAAADHPLDTTYVYQIARAGDGKSAWFSVFQSDGVTTVGTPQFLDFSDPAYSPLWGDLRIALNEFNRSSTFDNVFIPEPGSITLAVLGAVALWWRRRQL
jgi:hypothetical protein